MTRTQIVITLRESRMRVWSALVSSEHLLVSRLEEPNKLGNTRCFIRMKGWSKSLHMEAMVDLLEERCSFSWSSGVNFALKMIEPYDLSGDGDKPIITHSLAISGAVAPFVSSFFMPRLREFLTAGDERPLDICVRAQINPAIVGHSPARHDCSISTTTDHRNQQGLVSSKQGR
ncbi:hypothetical protein ACM61V_18120 [Sphingomonas sp. TX0543]|uniref:hypothetical protein n=1 Tax=Sphingomonas sp. TX0543 TaxID=3399682 RepID=UPI003AFAE20A